MKDLEAERGNKLYLTLFQHLKKATKGPSFFPIARFEQTFIQYECLTRHSSTVSYAKLTQQHWKLNPLRNANNAVQLYNPNSPVSPLESTSSFNQRFTIATRSDSLSSGFPYHPRLHDLKVSMDEWHLFTSDILNAGKLTAQEDYAAWSTGIVTGTLTSPLILIFAPVAGYYAGKSVHKKVLISKVKERLLADGDMRSVLRRWNERTFAPKGFQAWLELPVLGDEVRMEPKVERTKDEKKAAKKEKRRFKIVIIPGIDKHEYSWSSTASPAQTPLVVPFVEAPGLESKSPVEMEVGSSDHIQPLVNHEIAIEPEGDRKYEYRPVPPEIRPDCDTRPLEEARAEDAASPSTVVANGRMPTSEIIPPDEKKNKSFAYPTGTFEMDSGQIPAAKSG